MELKVGSIVVYQDPLNPEKKTKSKILEISTGTDGRNYYTIEGVEPDGGLKFFCRGATEEDFAN